MRLGRSIRRHYRRKAVRSLRRGCMTTVVATLLLIALPLVFTHRTPALAGAAPAVTVTFNGRPMSFDVPPRIDNGRTLVPLRAIFEALGAAVSWDGATQTVTATEGSTTVVLTIGSTTAEVDGQSVTLDVPAEIVGGRTLVPLRFVSEALGAHVGWDGSTDTVSITSTPLRQHVTGTVGAPGSCVYGTAADGALLPDPSCTPGATDPRVTQADLAETICVSGYTTEVRPPVSQTDRAKQELMLAYSDTQSGELDHLVPLELGGSSAIANLWPEPGKIPNPKDSVENELHRMVCDGQVSLALAQRLIETDWTTAVAQVQAGAAPATSTVQPAPPAPTPALAPPTPGNPPAGATALCNDGTYSYSQHRSGTCSDHHGVAEWLAQLPG